MVCCLGKPIVRDIYYSIRLGYRTYYYILRCGGCGVHLSGKIVIPNVIELTGKAEPSVQELEALFNKKGEKDER